MIETDEMVLDFDQVAFECRARGVSRSGKAIAHRIAQLFDLRRPHDTRLFFKNVEERETWRRRLMAPAPETPWNYEVPAEENAFRWAAESFRDFCQDLRHGMPDEQFCELMGVDQYSAVSMKEFLRGN